MEVYLLIALAIPLLLIALQDIKSRSIHVILIFLVLLISCVINYYCSSLTWKDSLLNIAFVGINIVGLVLYYSFKNKTFYNPVEKQIGIGDFLFLLSLTPLFKLKSYILFFIVALFFSLITHFAVNIFLKKQKTIPLAGYVAIFIILNVLIKLTLKENFLLHDCQ